MPAPPKEALTNLFRKKNGAWNFSGTDYFAFWWHYLLYFVPCVQDAGCLDVLCRAWHGLDAHDLASRLSWILSCAHAYALPSASAPGPTNQSSGTPCEKGQSDVRVLHKDLL